MLINHSDAGEEEVNTHMHRHTHFDRQPADYYE